jgi:hypothetical protein
MSGVMKGLKSKFSGPAQRILNAIAASLSDNQAGVDQTSLDLDEFQIVMRSALWAEGLGADIQKNRRDFIERLCTKAQDLSKDSNLFSEFSEGELVRFQTRSEDINAGILQADASNNLGVSMTYKKSAGDMGAKHAIELSYAVTALKIVQNCCDEEGCLNSYNQLLEGIGKVKPELLERFPDDLYERLTGRERGGPYFADNDDVVVEQEMAFEA